MNLMCTFRGDVSWNVYSYVVRCNENENKRPRGLDDLLGHLLVKRMPEMYKLSSTKISEP